MTPWKTMAGTLGKTVTHNMPLSFNNVSVGLLWTVQRTPVAKKWVAYDCDARQRARLHLQQTRLSIRHY